MTTTKPKKRTWVVVALVVILFLFLLRGCGDDGDDGGETPVAAAPAVPAAVYSQKQWTGVVAPYADKHSPLIQFDLDDGNRVSFDLTLTEAHRVCAGGSTPIAPSPAAYATALRQLAPPGTRLIVDRRGREAGELPDELWATSMAYIVDGNGVPAPASLNEQMVSSGAADIYPHFQLPTARFSGHELDYELQKLAASPPDGVPETLDAEYKAILAAYRYAWVNQLGETGVCARQYPEEAAARNSVEAARQRAATEQANAPETTSSTEDEYSTDSDPDSTGSGSDRGGESGVCQHSRWC